MIGNLINFAWDFWDVKQKKQITQPVRKQLYSWAKEQMT